MTVGSPAANTAWAASGSAQTLNSAAAVTLPPRHADPPMTTSRPIRAAASGKTRSSRARLVSGPTAATVTGSGEVISRSARATTAGRGSAAAGTAAAPPRPARRCRARGRPAPAARCTRDSRAPAATGTSERPARCSTRSAFSVVWASSTLPCTVVTRRRSTSGLARASRIARASSMPGSVSITRGRGTRGSSQRPHPTRRARRSGPGDDRPPSDHFHARNALLVDKSSARRKGSPTGPGMASQRFGHARSSKCRRSAVESAPRFPTFLLVRSTFPGCGHDLAGGDMSSETARTGPRGAHDRRPVGREPAAAWPA